MKKTYWAFGGMGAGFGGPNYLGSVEADSEQDAWRQAWEMVVEDYESYAGLHGVPTWDEIRENLEEERADGYPDGVPESMVNEAYTEEITSWTSCWVTEEVFMTKPEEYLEQWKVDHGY